MEKRTPRASWRERARARQNPARRPRTRLAQTWRPDAAWTWRRGHARQATRTRTGPRTQPGRPAQSVLTDGTRVLVINALAGRQDPRPPTMVRPRRGWGRWSGTAASESCRTPPAAGVPPPGNARPSSWATRPLLRRPWPRSSVSAVVPCWRSMGPSATPGRDLADLISYAEARRWQGDPGRVTGQRQAGGERRAACPCSLARRPCRLPSRSGSRRSLGAASEPAAGRRGHAACGPTTTSRWPHSRGEPRADDGRCRGR